jgi:hypothetical protein
MVALFVAGHVSAETADKQQVEAAKREYEQAIPPDNETARLAYVIKLAEIADHLVSHYRQSGERNDELMAAINSELQKHPAPKSADSKKLKQLLVGKWESPRHTYVFRANGKYGIEDGPVSGSWRIQGNQLIEDDSRGTIILLNRDYFIYTDGKMVFFHSRQKD